MFCKRSNLMLLTDKLRSEPLIAPLGGVDEAVKNASPEFTCRDQTDRSTWQTMR
jgi:hypothetical protein